MTKAVLTYSDSFYDLEVSGHSGYADYGSDIVCAAVSAVTLALCEYIKTLNCRSSLDVRDGYIHITAEGGLRDAVAFTECAFKPICSETFGYVEFSEKEISNDDDDKAFPL